MRTRVRYLRVLLIAVLLAAITAGCTISSTSSGGDDEEGTVTLTFWHYYSGTGEAWLKERVQAFEKDHAGVQVDLVKVVGDQQAQKLLASVATGSTPDLFINNIVVDYPTLVGGDVMADLTSYWEDYADQDQFPETAAWSSDGKVYNLLPFTNLLGLYYNVDVLKQVGIDEPPTTIPELEQALKAVQSDGRFKGLALSQAPDVEGAWLFAPQLLGQGVDYCNWGESQQQVGAAFGRLDAWAEKGYIPKAAATWDQNASWQQFMTGKYAFAINGNWQLRSVSEAGFDYGTEQFPAPEGGSSQVYPGGEGFGIGSKSEHPDLAWEFLEHAVLSTEGQRTIFTQNGSIPIRADVAELPVIKDDEYVQPFVRAAQDPASWPDNPKTADMQNSLGKAVSSVVSGQKSGEQAANQASADIAAAREDGGGSC